MLPNHRPTVPVPDVTGHQAQLRQLTAGMPIPGILGPHPQTQFQPYPVWTAPWAPNFHGYPPTGAGFNPPFGQWPGVWIPNQQGASQMVFPNPTELGVQTAVGQPPNPPAGPSANLSSISPYQVLNHLLAYGNLPEGSPERFEWRIRANNQFEAVQEISEGDKTVILTLGGSEKQKQENEINMKKRIRILEAANKDLEGDVLRMKKIKQEVIHEQTQRGQHSQAPSPVPNIPQERRSSRLASNASARVQNLI